MSQDSFLKVYTPEGFTFFDFDPKVIKKSLRKVASETQKDAKKRIAKRVISAPGEAPGRLTGAMYRAVKGSVSKRGTSAVLKVRRTDEMDAFYPAFVVYGHRGPKTDSVSQASTKRKGQKVAAPRLNFIEATAKAYAQRFADCMEDAFIEGIKS